MTTKLRHGVPEHVGMLSDRVAQARDLCARWVEDGRTPTLGVCVARRGVIVPHEAFGIVGPGPDTPRLERSSIFAAASVTKAITATLIMQLIEDGRLGLNRPAKEYLPEDPSIYESLGDAFAKHNVVPMVIMNYQKAIEFDFGLAKRLNGESSLTLSGQVLGSPSFMPPEQAGGRRKSVGRASDVYSLGGILYYLLTARAPFQADSLEHVITQVLNSEPVAPRLLDPSIPRDLGTIALKCLEKEPSRRYQTAKELAEELNRYLEHMPIRARPLTPPGRLWRWCRRKPVLASLAVLLHVVGAVGLAGILWQWQRA